MKKILLTLLGLVLFLYIVLSTGPEAILQSLFGLDPIMLVLALVFIIPGIQLKGFKQKMLVSSFKKGTSLSENTKIWLISFFFGIASPAKSGEAARALYLRNAFGVSLGQGLAVVFVERVSDILILFILAFLGIYSIAMPLANNNVLLPIVSIFFVFFIAALVLLLKKNLIKFILKPFFNLFAPEQYKRSLKEGFNDFYHSLFIYLGQPKFLIAFFVVSFFSWLVTFAQFWLLSIAFSMNLNFLSFLFVFPVVVLVEALPISVSGIGTRDAAAIVMFGLLGISSAVAVSFSIAILAFNIISAFFGFLFFNSTEKPI